MSTLSIGSLPFSPASFASEAASASTSTSTGAAAPVLTSLERAALAPTPLGGLRGTDAVSERGSFEASSPSGPTDSELSARDELSMISLQSLISQRQMAIQLGTELLSKLQESQQSVIHNIGD